MEFRYFVGWVSCYYSLVFRGLLLTNFLEINELMQIVPSKAIVQTLIIIPRRINPGMFGCKGIGTWSAISGNTTVSIPWKGICHMSAGIIVIRKPTKKTPYTNSSCCRNTAAKTLQSIRNNPMVCRDAVFIAVLYETLQHLYLYIRGGIAQVFHLYTQELFLSI